ncbi:MAG: hypothetical protein ACRD3Y_02445, partial [Bryobacteraceae bacterium]
MWRQSRRHRDSRRSGRLQQESLEGRRCLTARLIECVPNFSEGRDASVVDALERAFASVPGVLILHRTSDPD